MLKIQDGTFEQIIKFHDGLVLVGVGGDLMEWVNGIATMWKEEGISKTSKAERIFAGVYKLISTGGRVDLVLDFKPEEHLNVSRLALWRIQWGSCSWISDFRVNYASHYGYERMDIDEDE